MTGNTLSRSIITISKEVRERFTNSRLIINDISRDNKVHQTQRIIAEKITSVTPLCNPPIHIASQGAFGKYISK